MRYNGYHNKQENFLKDHSVNNPGSGISARFDLASSILSNLSGGVDSKVKIFLKVR